MKSRKEAAKRYYDTKVKPFRKNKPATTIPFMRCFLCGKLIDFKKLFDKAPSIRIDMKQYSFGGRANIKVVDFVKIDPEIREEIRNMLISKLKAMLWALEQRVEPLQSFIETTLGRQLCETHSDANVETQLNNPMEVKYGN